MVEAVQVVWCDLSPVFVYTLSEFLNRNRRVPPEFDHYPAPHRFNQIHVWGVCWPFHVLERLVIDLVSSSPTSIGRSIVILEDEVGPDSAENVLSGW